MLGIFFKRRLLHLHRGYGGMWCIQLEWWRVLLTKDYKEKKKSITYPSFSFSFRCLLFFSVTKLFSQRNLHYTFLSFVFNKVFHNLFVIHILKSVNTMEGLFYCYTFRFLWLVFSMCVCVCVLLKFANCCSGNFRENEGQIKFPCSVVITY